MRLKRHKNNRTVAVQVLKSFFVKEKNQWKFKISWWNIANCRPPFEMFPDHSAYHHKMEVSAEVWQRDWESYVYGRDVIPTIPLLWVQPLSDEQI